MRLLDGPEYSEHLELCAPDDPYVVELQKLYRYEHIGMYGHPDPNPKGDGLDPGWSVTVVGLNGFLPVAMGKATLEGDDAILRRMFTTWEQRRKGWARDILQVIVAETTKLGAKRLLLETGVQALPALALYYSEGFKPVEPFGFYAEADGSVFLGKDL